MKIIAYLLIILFSVFTSHEVLAQSPPYKPKVEVVSSDWKDHGLTIGLNYGRYAYGEVGYFKHYVYEAGGFPVSSYGINYGLELSYIDEVVLAPKVQGRFHFYFLNASLSALYYSNLAKEYAIKLRPEIGIGLQNFDINYGYNIGVVKDDFTRSNKSLLSIRYYLKLKRRHLNEYDAKGNKINR
ncbi:hypothetical protein [Rufibacter aurantiacus]|uniref:hypothetical protein n=1 Tax=Rufibacter aurantiacus TaxID=2817374 RepID=UPI001B30298F|nr:hypothetical protein [Rufibacter aurantiacus]